MSQYVYRRKNCLCHIQLCFLLNYNPVLIVMVSCIEETVASILYFWNFNRNQTENDGYCQKTITLHFLQNVCVLVCSVFLHLHLKFAKSAIMTQKILIKNINLGTKKR
jgi:hypothetical protein